MLDASCNNLLKIEGLSENKVLLISLRNPCEDSGLTFRLCESSSCMETASKSWVDWKSKDNDDNDDNDDALFS